MKAIKSLFLTSVLVVANLGHAQTVENDLIGLGMKPELAEYLAGIIPAGAALDNNVYLKSDNAAGTTTIGVLKVDGTDDTVLNADSGDLIKISENGTAGLTIDPSINVFSFAGRATIGSDSTTDAITQARFSDGVAKAMANFNTNIFRVGTSSNHAFELFSNNVARWQIDTSGQLVQNATNGGNLAFAKNGTGIVNTVANAVSAAGSAIGDATQLAATVNRVATVGAGQGVKLWVPSGGGMMIYVQNVGANDLLVYPPDASGTINGGAAGAAITLASATKGAAIFYFTATNTWIAMEAAGAA